MITNVPYLEVIIAKPAGLFKVWSWKVFNTVTAQTIAAGYGVDEHAAISRGHLEIDTYIQNPELY